MKEFEFVYSSGGTLRQCRDIGCASGKTNVLSELANTDSNDGSIPNAGPDTYVILYQFAGSAAVPLNMRNLDDTDSHHIKPVTKLVASDLEYFCI